VVAFSVCPTNATATFPGRNGRIAFSTGGNVFTIRPDGTALRVVADGHGPVWSPDGRQIAYALSNSVYTIPAEGGRRRFVIAQAVAPAWSPSGKRLAVVRRTGIWLVNRNGTEPRQLTAFIPTGSSLDWSPDGSRIVFSYRGTIVEASVRTGTLATLRDPTTAVADCDQGERFSPTWSPDGSMLALERVRDCGRYTQRAVWTIEIVDAVDGTGIDGVDAGVSSPYDVGSILPTWSPDGHSLAFLHDTRDSSGTIVLTVFDLESRTSYKVRRLPPRASSEAARPDWQPLTQNTR
jgi:Tol biopolymer transport system component